MSGRKQGRRGRRGTDPPVIEGPRNGHVSPPVVPVKNGRDRLWEGRKEGHGRKEGRKEGHGRKERRKEDSETRKSRKQEKKKERKKAGRQAGRQEGRKEGRKKGWKEGGKEEGRKETCAKMRRNTQRKKREKIG